MAIVVAPGATFEAVLEKAPSGLTAPITGYQVVDGVGGTTVARTTTGIVETPAGSGVYVATLTAPSVAGQYVIVWDWSGGILSSTSTASEELVVTSTAPTAAAVNPIDLTTLAAVRAFLRTPATDTSHDDLIQTSITRASQACMRYMDRRVRPLDTVDQVRLFPAAGAYRTRTVRVMDLSAAPTTIRLLADDAATEVATLATADRLLLPLDRQSTDPIEALQLLASAGDLDPSWYVEVTGKWGWPAVPADVEEAVVKTVAARIRGEVQGFPGDRLPDDDLLGRPEGIPSGARRLLDYYRGAPGIA